MGPSRGIAFARTCLQAIVGALVSAQAHAFTPTVTASGIPVRWKGQPRLNLAGNSVNRNGLSAKNLQDAVVRSLQRWEAAAGGSLHFDYWQGTDPRIFPAVSAFDGLSALYFSSNAGASGDARNSEISSNSLTANVLGLTQVWYDTSSGEILEADIALNDRDFHFTTDVRDTSGYGSAAGGARFSGARSNVFIENVITHELGHVLGLSHSGGLQSTMLFMESPEQAHLGCDETVAIRALYPAADAGSRGSLSGTVTTEAGSPVFGAHVVAISRRRGTVLATGITDRAGHYAIGGLEPGVYFLMVEPFYAGPQTLPSYYSTVRSDVCPGGRSFNRTLLTEPSGVLLQAVPVSSGTQVTAPLLRVSCDHYAGAAVVGSDRLAVSSGTGGAVPVFNGLAGSSGLGAVDRFHSARPNHYLLHAVSGHLELHAMSYSLYSPIHPTIELLDAATGSPVPTRTSDQVYVGDSGYVNYDSALVATDLPPADYVLRVTAKPLDSTLYPAGPISLDPIPFLLITGSVNEAEPALSASIPFNARCRMEENFAEYASPPGNPPRRVSEKPESSTGFCGTVDSGTAGGHGPGGGAIAGWLLPWGFMLAFVRMVKLLPNPRGTVNLRG